MKVKIKKLHPNAVIPFKKYPSDFCYDVVAVSEEEVAPNVWKYGLGIALQIDRNESEIIKVKDDFREVEFDSSMFHVKGTSTIDLKDSPINLSVDLRPRSSIYKTGMCFSCCTGTVDENYTNEISAVFYHVMPNMPRYKVGDKIGQIKIGVTFPIDFVEVEELDERDRGLNGYGSTDVKQ